MSSPSARTTEIALAGMRFHVLVGILPHERTTPQPLEVDLRVRRHASSTAVIDYRDLYTLVRSAVSDAPVEYLETAAESIIDRTLKLEGVAWARVALRKPHVALGGPLDFAEVAVEGENA